MNQFEPVIGLEIHVQLKTQSKMFCRSPNTEATQPNVNVCEVCTGQPGSLPVANQAAIEKAIITGLALGCSIAERSKFDRKNYFYPDLPKGYQISQYDMPLCGRGVVDMAIDGSSRPIRITRAHLEEDAGKLIHPAGAKYSLVDLNRAGVPLLEIVTEPDFRSAGEAKIFLQQLRTLARYLGVSDADMEKGHLRCDANISLRPAGTTALPDYKVEVKNMNSFRAVEDALKYEIQRQSELLADGKKLKKETRGWSDAKRHTVSQRDKEGSEDYRYFPEPDLPMLQFSRDFIERLRANLPELPARKLSRLMAEYGLPLQLASQIVEDKNLAEYFEAIVSELKEWFSVENIGDPAVTAANIREAALWCVGVFTELVNKAGLGYNATKVNPENFAELLKMIHQGAVSKTAAKQVLSEMFATGDDPSRIVEAKGLAQVSGSEALEAIVDRVIAANPGVVADVQAGKKQAIGFLVGKVMGATEGKANPSVVNKILNTKLR